MDTQRQTEGAGAPVIRGIDVGGLEKQLAAMWSRTAGEGGVNDAGMTRVCVVNLIVYVPKGTAREELDPMLDELARELPSRVILLFADRESEARLAAVVSTRCQDALKGRKQVCGEQVNIEASGASLYTVASAVEPLLVPDIPAFLWWKDVPDGDDKLFSRLVEMVDRVVIDSAAFDRPHADLRRVSRLFQERGEQTRVSDLNWGRLTTWRHLIAGFWDVPDYREHLEQLGSVLIEYAPHALAPAEIGAQALLAAGWLASRLGWSVAGDGVREGQGFRFTMKSGSRRFELEFRPAGAVGDGAMRRIVFRGGGEGGAEFFARMDATGARVETCAKIGGGARAGRVLAYEAKSEGRRLGRELSILARDEVYEESVSAAVRLLEAAGAWQAGTVA